jgi:hypothetical protein
MGKTFCSFTSKECPQENPLWIYHYINREYVDVHKDRWGLGKEFICTKNMDGRGRAHLRRHSRNAANLGIHLQVGLRKPLQMKRAQAGDRHIGV